MAKKPSTANPADISTDAEDIRTGSSPEALARSFRDNLYYVQGRFPSVATLNDFYQAAAYTVRDRLLKRWLETFRKIIETDRKVVCYLSAEFLMGPQLGNNLLNLGLYREAEEGIRNAGLGIGDLPAARRRFRSNPHSCFRRTCCRRRFRSCSLRPAPPGASSRIC